MTMSGWRGCRERGEPLRRAASPRPPLVVGGRPPGREGPAPPAPAASADAAAVARIHHGKVDCVDCQLEGSDLTNTCVKGHDLHGADFDGANATLMCMSYANFSGASFRGTNLSGANLTESSLKRASIVSTNLAGANLTSADLAGARERHPDEGQVPQDELERRLTEARTGVASARAEMARLGDVEARLADAHTHLSLVAGTVEELERATAAAAGRSRRPGVTLISTTCARPEARSCRR